MNQLLEIFDLYTFSVDNNTMGVIMVIYLNATHGRSVVFSVKKGVITRDTRTVYTVRCYAVLIITINSM